MRPIQVLNAIVFGSAVAITFGLTGVLIIFLVLQREQPQMSAELPVLMRAAGLFSLLALAAGASLYAMLKELPWRWAAQVAMWLMVTGIALSYWPQ
ncbi:hypothetical protein ACG33_08990 [Steroidobacter denitrificans]|uniref:Uncharacterized protein n=1 Tax=Steroidobacter denitrificans TaxID=465721 RepID=A0A127F9Y2_STEDE|nr:hypothetical protein [Steroidobacter denitrificans]AMN47227.1 hypothetical protein ACG33_08990 [Steroidobacter denitrificans]